MDNVLHLLGIARKAGRVEVGEEPVGASARARQARLILVASDAADNSARRAAHFAQAGKAPWFRVPYTKGELGGTVGRASCAMLALTDVGLAAALLGARRRRTAVCTIALLVCFAAVVGNTPSVLRAVFMQSMLLLAPLLGREEDKPTSLCAVLMLLLLQNPYAAASVSLQLSFAAVAGIYLFSGPLTERLGSPPGPRASGPKPAVWPPGLSCPVWR